MKNDNLKFKIIFFCVIFLGGFLVWGNAQADTHTASSCSNSDVSSAISASEIGDTVSIPAGECTWTSGITVTKNITIQGAGYENTKIAMDGTAFTLSETSTRLTGIGFILANGDVQINIVGGSGWRIDHCQFTNNYADSRESIDVNGTGVTSTPAGLIDNNDFVNGRIVVGRSSNLTEARALWAADHPFGADDTTGLNTVYIEDNTFYKTVANGGNVIDAANYVGAYVARYNTITGVTSFMVHGFQDVTAQNDRGPKAWEIYGNSFTASSYMWNPAMFIRAGTGFAFNNSITNYSIGIKFDVNRVFTNVATAGLCNGESPYDGNDPTVANGWPCRDQIGRGKDLSLWTTENPYPDQTSQPAYLWSNMISDENSVAYVANGCDEWIVSGRDYFEPGASNGVRCGTLANIPETCTTDQAYWATNQSCSDMTGMVGVNPATLISGTLYKCTATDTWTEYYTPYTYPHPLRTESNDIVAPASPTGLSVS